MIRGTLALLCLVIPLRAHALEAELCAAHLRTIAAQYEKDQTIPVFRHPNGTGKYGIARLDLWGKTTDLVDGRFMNFGASAWYEPDAFYIGVANYPREGSFHFYLIADDLRMDGQPGHTNLRQGKDKKPPMATDGVLFKIKADAQTVRDIRARMMAVQRSCVNNCVEPVRRVMQEVGIDIDATQTGLPYASAQALAGNLMLGQISKGDRTLPVSLLASTPDKLREFLKHAVDVDAVSKDLLEGRVKPKLP